jgi:DeoR/GlpR family transcriptional regulator of sugar metabolism
MGPILFGGIPGPTERVMVGLYGHLATCGQTGWRHFQGTACALLEQYDITAHNRTLSCIWKRCSGRREVGLVLAGLPAEMLRGLRRLHHGGLKTAMPRNSLNAEARKNALVKVLAEGRQVSIASASERFGVHPMTIRRDLAALEKAGVLVRCYGGGIPAKRITFEFEFDQRRRTNQSEKRVIGAAAAGFVAEGDTVILDTGTTTAEVARALVGSRTRCSVTTSSLVIASELWGVDGIELTLLGGHVRGSSPDLIGPGVELMLNRLSADVAFLGTDGIDANRGCFTIDVEAARVAEKVAASARRVVVVADSSKLGRHAPVRYLPLEEMQELVTDANAPRQFIADLRKRGVRVTIVPMSGRSG